VTHDHRILDLADRHLALEDGRLISLARTASQQTTDLMAGLARAGQAQDLTREIAELDQDHLFEFLAESTEDLAQLCRVIDTARGHLATSLLDRLLIAATFKAGQWLAADRVTVFVVDWPERTLRSRVAQTDGSGMLTIQVSVDAGIAGHVARCGEKVNLADAYDSPLFNPEVDQRTGYRTRSVLCLPLQAPGVGVFAVAQVLNKQDGERFTGEDEERFEAFLQPLGKLLLQVLAAEKYFRGTPENT
jgi:GAF domain-containing protein